MKITLALVTKRNEMGVDNAEYIAEAEAWGRCPKHPAYTPDNCASCGTHTEMSH